MAQLAKCEDSLSFTSLSKDGAQGGRVMWKDEAARLQTVLEGERNSSNEIWSKLETVKGLFTECDNGFCSANRTIEFLVQLVNEKLGKVDVCESALNASQSNITELSTSLEECQTSSAGLGQSLGRKTQNFTSYGKLLDQCRQDLKKAQDSLGDFTQSDKGN